MRLNFNPPRRPPGGFIYNDPSGINLTEPDYLQKLVDKLTQFRLNNNLPPGDPEHDIALQFKAKGWDFLLEQSEPGAGEATRRTSKEEQSEAIQQWVARLWRDPPKKLFSQKQAKDRVGVCSSCPHLYPWKPVEPAELETQRKLIILSRSELPDGIGYCDVHRWHAGLACLMENHSPERIQAAPKECWLAKENQAQP